MANPQTFGQGEEVFETLTAKGEGVFETQPKVPDTRISYGRSGVTAWGTLP